MRFSIFGYVNYTGALTAETWPAPPSGFDSDTGYASMEEGFSLFELAHAVGFDSLTVAEHHYAARQLTPSPIVFAAALSQRIPEARVSVYGCSLPLHNPVRIAEEIAMLDHLLKGKLTVGLFRGTPNEYLTYGTYPAASRAMLVEGIELVLRTWTEPEPFAWEGSYYRYRQVASWPQPYQRPHPPLVVSISSPESAEFAGERGFNAAIAYVPSEHAASLTAIYRDTAMRCGWEPRSDNILYRHFAHIAETDEQAAEEYERYRFAGADNMLGRKASPERQRETAALVLGSVAAAGWAAKSDDRQPDTHVMDASPFIGSPATVAERLRETAATIGGSQFDLTFSGPGLPHDVAKRSIRMFGEQVIPQLRDL